MKQVPCKIVLGVIAAGLTCPIAAQVSAPPPGTLVPGSKLSVSGSMPAAVAKWDDLANVSGAFAKFVYVAEPGRSGFVEYLPTRSQPLWARAAPPAGSAPSGAPWTDDIRGLTQTDLSGKGKWVYRWAGAVDFARLGPTKNGTALDERDAFARIAHLASVVASAGPGADVGEERFDDIYVPPGEYDGHLLVRVTTPLRIRGGGPEETIFVGDGIVSHTAFELDSELVLEGLGFTNQGRVVEINAYSLDDLAMTLKMRNVSVQHVDDDYDPEASSSGVVHSVPFGPLQGSTFRLEMSDCRFDVSGSMTHIRAVSGLEGFVEDSVFEGGRFGILTIPAANPGGFSEPANGFSPDFRITNCEFGRLSYENPGAGADSFHLQVAGVRWVVSGCRFGEAQDTGFTSSGNLYSNLQDSVFVGCSFVGGGSFQIFMKGGARYDAPGTNPMNGNGWGNTFIGCTFEGVPDPLTSSATQRTTGYLNVKEQRFIGCSFRDYAEYALWLNKEGVMSANDGGDLLVQACDFSSSRSRSAIRLDRGGRDVRILDCVFTGITGTTGALTSGGIIVFRNSPGNQVFEDITVEGCTFRDNDHWAVRFYGGGSEIRRFRFRRNSVIHPTGPDLVVGDSIGSITDFVLEDNYFDVLTSNWSSFASHAPGFIGSSVNNTFIGPQPQAEVRGVQRGTRVMEATSLADMDPLAIDPMATLVLVGAVTSPADVALDAGAFVGQRATLVGDGPPSLPTTIVDGGFAALGADQTLGPNDCLELVWNGAAWCKVSYSDN